VRSGGAFRLGGHTSVINGNGNTVLLLDKGIEQQEGGNGGQDFLLAGTEGTYGD